MEQLARQNRLAVKQKKEWGEILSGIETKNAYTVLDAQGRPLYTAAEESSFLARFFLKALRPFTLHVVNAGQGPVLRLNRPFTFYFHRIEVVNGAGERVGSVERRFAWFRRIYSVRDRHGTEIYDLFGPILHPWTFEIRRAGQGVGKITKKWSGLGKEMFTDADHFGIEFPPSADGEHKMILLGAVFLVDFVHFENKGGN
jgi:uncharacterized protein YxjI